MYAGTIFEWIDLSEIKPIETATENKPFFMAAFSSEKGTEDPMIFDNAPDFYKMFVTPDPSQKTGYFIPFAKHGQPLLQAAKIMDSGGKIYAKRIVATDATLANITIYASVTPGEVQKSVNGVLQYYSTNASGDVIEVSDAVNSQGQPNTPVMINTANISYTSVSDANVNNINALTASRISEISNTYVYTVGAMGLEIGDYYFRTSADEAYVFTLTTALVEGNTIRWDGVSNVVDIYMPGASTAQISMAAINPPTGNELIPVVTSTFPILIVTDNGRGVSKKKFRIVPNYDYSKDLEYMLYNFQVIEEGATLANNIICLDSEKQYLSQNVSIKKQFGDKKSQIKVSFLDNSFSQFIQAIADATGMEYTDVLALDILNGKNRRGEALDSFAINEDADSFDFQYLYGILLQSGDNGSFGNIPYGTAEYATEMVKFFSGEVTDDIYDVDNLKLNFIVDANYPEPVKTAIENFVMFREDCFFFCDFGFAVSNYQDAANIIIDDRKADSKFVSYCHLYYDIIDPYTQKQITVTCSYDLTAILVSHYYNGRIRPLAGQLYGVTFPNAIEGTVNFIPKLIPGLNQKQMMNDIRVNYATYYDGVLTMDSEYTSQKKHTQFSYINNVLATQEVIQAIRTRCPKIRYSFLNTEGLIKYKEDVEMNVLSKYRSNFATLELVYLGDSTYEQNKIFYAGINVRFNDFVQTEVFKVYALL